MKRISKKAITRGLVTLTILASTPTLGWADMSPEEIKNGYKVNAAFAQFYRWYQYYERSEGGIDNALDILTQDVNVKSGLGEANGHEEYKARVTQLPTSWKNAHFPKDPKVTFNADGSTSISSELTYLNEGLNPDGKIRQAELTYTMALTQGDDVLPKFSAIKIEQNSESEAETFVDAYAINRMRSLVHYWLTLIEDPSRNPEPLQEILSDEFTLNFSSGAITTYDDLKEWLAGPGSQVSASTHVISDFAAEENEDGTYSIQMDFDWEGILPNGAELVAKTRHSWTATNDVTERFARIKSVDVEILEPFHPKEK